MKSERRDTPRIPIALEAILNYTNRGYQRAFTRDISLDGAFVETGRDRLAAKKPVELAIRLPLDGRQRFHRFRAKVVRAAPGGTALVFERVDTDAYAALLDLVFSRQPKSAA